MGTDTARAVMAWENEGGYVHRPVTGTSSSPGTTTVRVGRIYDPSSAHDGIRVLVDRLWPRGMTRSRAEIDEWCKDVAPSTALRTWYHHDPARFAEFRRRYRLELDCGTQASALRHLTELARCQVLTLLTASRAVATSEAVVRDRHDRGKSDPGGRRDRQCPAGLPRRGRPRCPPRRHRPPAR